eukprot:248684_1
MILLHPLATYYESYSFSLYPSASYSEPFYHYWYHLDYIDIIDYEVIPLAACVILVSAIEVPYLNLRVENCYRWYIYSFDTLTWHEKNVSVKYCAENEFETTQLPITNTSNMTTTSYT